MSRFCYYLNDDNLYVWLVAVCMVDISSNINHVIQLEIEVSDIDVDLDFFYNFL